MLEKTLHFLEAAAILFILNRLTTCRFVMYKKMAKIR